MAFDTPLEADRPGELNLINTFVRAPVLGTLMWIFGGDVAKEFEEQEKHRQLVDAVMECDDEEMTVDTTTDSTTINNTNNNQTLEEDYDDDVNVWPVINDASVLSTNGVVGQERRGKRDKAISSATAALAQRKDFTLGNLALVEQSNNRVEEKSVTGRQMSWSDESGQSLCEYFDESCRVSFKLLAKICPDIGMQCRTLRYLFVSSVVDLVENMFLIAFFHPS